MNRERARERQCVCVCVCMGGGGRWTEVTDSLYQVMVFHVKIKDDTISKHIGKVGHKAKGCKVVE